MGATEPMTTSACYDPQLPYNAPAGRLPVLGSTRAAVDLTRAQALNELNQITVRNLQQTDSHDKVQADIARTDSEIRLLDQKRETELGQVSDVTSTGAPISGIISKQKGLFQKQTDGFDRDAEQKLAKLFTDTWVARQTTDGGLTPLDAGIGDAEIAAVLAKAKAGINLT